MDIEVDVEFSAPPNSVIPHTVLPQSYSIECKTDVTRDVISDCFDESARRKLQVRDIPFDVLDIIFRLLRYQYDDDEPFLWDPRLQKWYSSIRDLKALCLVSKWFHFCATPMLYAYVRIRRIPCLPLLVKALQSNAQQPYRWHFPHPLSGHIRALDLSFAIPIHWNAVYKSSIVTLLRIAPNISVYRSRPLDAEHYSHRPIPASIITMLITERGRNEVLVELDLSLQESARVKDLVGILLNCVELRSITLGEYLFIESDEEELLIPSEATVSRLTKAKLWLRQTPAKDETNVIQSCKFFCRMRDWSLPSFSTLVVVFTDEATPSRTPLHGFLVSHGSNIKSLTFTDQNFFVGERVRQYDINLILPYCAGLQYLKYSFEKASPIVSAVQFRHLRKISLVGPPYGETVEHVQAMSSVLENGQKVFPALQEVFLENIGESHRKKLALLRQALCPCTIIPGGISDLWCDWGEVLPHQLDERTGDTDSESHGSAYSEDDASQIGSEEDGSIYIEDDGAGQIDMEAALEIGNINEWEGTDSSESDMSVSNDP